MKIILVGAGRMGQEIAARLVEEGHDITVVDNNAGCLGEVSNCVAHPARSQNPASHSHSIREPFRSTLISRMLSQKNRLLPACFPQKG